MLYFFLPRSAKKVTFFISLALMVFIVSCTKNNMETASKGSLLSNHLMSLASPPAATGQPVSAAINQNQHGYNIANNFLGLSYEINNIASDPSFLRADNAVLLQLIQNLGASGMIRIGGNSSDKVVWTGNVRNASTGKDSLATTDVDQLAAFVSATGGWKLVLGLNLGYYNPSLSANEAVYVSNALGANLYALQFGNEPASYSSNGLRPSTYNVNTYMAEWRVYRDSVRNLLPLAPLAGPDISRVTNNATSYLKTFADSLHSYINMLSGHYYGDAYSPTSSTDTETVFDSITSVKTYTSTPGQLGKINTLATSYSIPYRITECGSVASGGRAGLSDAFGSALWALDFMWQVATNNGQGVNFHGSATALYTPIARTNGVIVPRPGYYAMLAFAYGGSGGSSILPVALTANGKLCTAYACTKNGKTFVTLVNRDTVNLSYTLNLTNTVTEMDLYRLTASSITAKTGITFAGAAVNADGTYSPGSIEQYTVGSNSVVVNVAARTAVVAVLQ